MTKMLKIALASMMSVSALGGVALAQTAAPAATTPAPMMSDDMVSVVVIPENAGEGSDTSIPGTVINASPETIQSAQAEISSDAALRMTLESKNVQLQNVVAIQTAANGGKTVYVR
ncbi:hypothetical protein HFC70_07625 [Agrobacterium sp. a22-2]|uniref:hypothetical protein n=1 Tax=Agrobacterium sp. a22-2 TaxID=2283840 RepID=UPI0014484883|nr:hypothetical protein [Agrobacterium sp. a22-2]NKN36227.1 hypothetical protein [Agrobacterium sp. a22-2]